MKRFPCNFLYIFLVVAFLQACQYSKTQQSDPVTFGSTNNSANTVLSFEIISFTENSYGYNILKNGKIYIHQPHVPAMAGNQGFRTKKQAEKAAEFVMFKIQQNIIPPTVTSFELDSLGLLNNVDEK